MKLHCLNLAVGSTTASPNPTVKNFRQKGASSWSRDLIKNFKPPSIFLEWMKLHSLNLASGSTTATPTLVVKIFHRNARGLGHKF